MNSITQGCDFTFRIQASQYVAMPDNNGVYKQILITEADSEISDSDSETNRAKFTYKFAHNSHQ